MVECRREAWWGMRKGTRHLIHLFSCSVVFFLRNTGISTSQDKDWRTTTHHKLNAPVKVLIFTSRHQNVGLRLKTAPVFSKKQQIYSNPACTKTMVHQIPTALRAIRLKIWHQVKVTRKLTTKHSISPSSHAATRVAPQARDQIYF
jgi:hypothetical protein